MSPQPRKLAPGIGLCLTLACAPLTADGTPTPIPDRISFGFWNLENLFDAEDDPANEGDNEYLPDKEWTAERYALKIEHLAQAIEDLNVDLLGVCEVENKRVLQDLVEQPALQSRNYQIIHFESPDLRGIDLGLLHDSKLQVIGEPHLHPIDLGPEERPTRGVLEVTLQIDDQPLTVLVNHWPSRYGGVEASNPRRAKAAAVVRSLADAQMQMAAVAEREADVLIMGDLNDDPFSPSVRDHLKAVRERRTVAHPYNRLTTNAKQKAPKLYNPSWSFFAQADHGTYYYWNEWTWNVFDQVIVSPGLIDGEGLQYVEGSLRVHAPTFLRDTDKNANRPARFRKFKGVWEEGYSDHFAVRGELEHR